MIDRDIIRSAEVAVLFQGWREAAEMERDWHFHVRHLFENNVARERMATPKAKAATRDRLAKPKAKMATRARVAAIHADRKAAGLCRADLEKTDISLISGMLGAALRGKTRDERAQLAGRALQLLRGGLQGAASEAR